MTVEQIPSLNMLDYAYDLPEGKIARYPLPGRDGSKLLVWKNGELSESLFRDIDMVLPDDSLLVSNNTRVIHARLLFCRPTGARIEIFCLQPSEPSDYQLSFQQRRSVQWKCLVGNAGKWKSGILERPVLVGGNTIILKAEKLSKVEQSFLIMFSWDSDDTFASVIEAAGQIPIPPYLNRPAEESDNTTYQTLYAKIDGSVAAPTAGLHFTEAVIGKLKKKNIRFAELTLHVGAGTFQPVKSENIAGHKMHTETVLITAAFLKKLLSHAGKIICIGTTSVRSLESLFWLGLKTGRLSPGELPAVEQWEPYRPAQDGNPKESILKILDYMESNKLNQLTFTTSLLICPGYRFRMTNGMVTNFHQPQSTLLLLVAAFLGPNWKKAYDYALNNDFRFLSYGDSNLYMKE